jgi:hypothetical protein
MLIPGCRSQRRRARCDASGAISARWALSRRAHGTHTEITSGRACRSNDRRRLYSRRNTLDDRTLTMSGVCNLAGGHETLTLEQRHVPPHRRGITSEYQSQGAKNPICEKPRTISLNRKSSFQVSVPTRTSTFSALCHQHRGAAPNNPACVRDR